MKSTVYHETCIFNTRLIIQKNVRDLLEKRGWKDYDLADEARVSICTIRRVINPSRHNDKRGIPSFSTLCLVADILDVDLAYLVTKHS